jgi:hypothetical protein
MNSMHLQRLAIDLNVFKDNFLITDKETLKPLGDYWQSLSPKNRWGGNFTSLVDTPHYERQP